MTAQIIILADRKTLLERRRNRAEQAAQEIFALQAAWTALAFESLSTAAKIATTPLWPRGIDDLEF